MKINSLSSIFINAGLFGSMVIGAGMFSLPYFFYKMGFWSSMIFFFLAILVSLFIHAKYTEIVFEDKDNQKRFISFVGDYLGEKQKWFGGVIVTGGLIITLTIYLTLVPSFISVANINLLPDLSVSLFWILGSIFLLIGLANYAVIDFIIFMMMLAVILLIAICGFIFGARLQVTSSSNLIEKISFLGPFLFSLSGRSVISSLWNEYHSKGGERKSFLSIVKWGTIIPAIFYLIFIYGIYQLSPLGISSDAISQIFLMPTNYRFLITILGLLSLITSYVFLNLELSGILEKDFRLGKKMSRALTIFLPMSIYFFGRKSFIDLIAIAGGIFLVIENMLVLRMSEKQSGSSFKANLFLWLILIILFVTELIWLIFF